ncbi:hypothetical protein D3C71_1661660 [compost metagenome]
MIADLIKTGCKCVLGRLLILFHHARVIIPRNTHDFLKRQNHVGFLNLFLSNNNSAVFNPPGRLHDHALITFNRQFQGIKIIYFTRFFKADTNYAV